MSNIGFVTIGAIDGLSRAEALDEDFDSFAEMITLGFGCGMTRVATLTVPTVPEMYGLDPATNIHHEYEHTTAPHEFYRPGADPAPPDDDCG